MQRGILLLVEVMHMVTQASPDRARIYVRVLSRLLLSELAERRGTSAEKLLEDLIAAAAARELLAQRTDQVSEVRDEARA
jgi:hypothetical protein